MYKAPKLTPVKLYQAPVLVDVKAISALSVCLTGGSASKQVE